VQKATGISKIEISRYERGKYFPLPENLKKLAKFYEVPYSTLRKLYFEETITDKDEREALTVWVLENLKTTRLMNYLKNLPKKQQTALLKKFLKDVEKL